MKNRNVLLQVLLSIALVFCLMFPSVVNLFPMLVAAASSIDLTVTSVNAPTTGQAGGYIAVSWTVKNQGSVASGTFYNRISLATTPYGTDISLGNFAMASISAGSSLSDAEVPQIPSSVSPGYYYVTVYADSFVQITEYNENNNIEKATYQIYISPAVTVPTAPTLNDVVGTSNNVILAWTDNSNNEDGFKIERKEGTSGTYTQVATTSANVYAYADTGLQFGKVYCYRVRAYNSAGNSGYSSEKCATTLSTPTLSSPSNGATLTTNTVTLTWNCVTGASGYAIKVSKTSCGGGDIFNSASTSCQQQLSNLANGVYYWQVQAAATTYPGLSEYSACRYFTVAYAPPDTTPPTVSISSPSNGQTFTTATITVSGTASDNVGISKVEVKVGSGSWQLASGTTSWSKSVSLSPGSNTIYAKATDTSGNPSSQASVTVNYNPPDTTSPTVSISSPSNGQTFTTATITVSGTAWDNVGVSKVEVKVGSGSWQLASGTTSWSKSVSLSPGSNTIYAKATDMSGNPSSQASVTATYTPPDTTPPTVSISYPSNGQTFTTSAITVTGTASDNVGVSKVEVKVGSGSWVLASGTNSWSKSFTLSPGSNTIYAKATDTSSNTDETSVTVTYSPASSEIVFQPPYGLSDKSGGSESFLLGEATYYSEADPSVGCIKMNAASKVSFAGSGEASAISALGDSWTPGWSGTATIAARFDVTGLIQWVRMSFPKYITQAYLGVNFEASLRVYDDSTSTEVWRKDLTIYNKGPEWKFISPPGETDGVRYIDTQYIIQGSIELEQDHQYSWYFQVKLWSRVDVSGFATATAGGNFVGYEGGIDLIDVRIIAPPVVIPEPEPIVTSENVLHIGVASPVDLLIVDPEGRAVGFDFASQQEVNEIPEASYSGNGTHPQLIIIPKPVAGEYSVSVFGTDTGFYDMVGFMRCTTGETVGLVASEIPTTYKALHEYEVDWDALASDNGEITIKKDNDGDGEVDVSVMASIPKGPTDPSPAHNAMEVPVNAMLSWVGATSDSIVYNVYLGTNVSGLELVSQRQAETTYIPTLNSTTQYYWEVVAVNEYGICSPGAVWAFTTGERGLPYACFIATAAYGTPMASEVQTLRDFRDEYLMPNPLGQALVNLYYKASPPIASFITEHPGLKPLVRAGLVPTVAMSTIAVNTTTAEKVAIVGLLLLISVILAMRATRRQGRGSEYT